MSSGNAAHNASKTALTRRADSSPPLSGTNMHTTLLNATLQTLTVMGAQHRPQLIRLGVEPDRMRAGSGQKRAERAQYEGWNGGWSSLDFFASGAGDELA